MEILCSGGHILQKLDIDVSRGNLMKSLRLGGKKHETSKLDKKAKKAENQNAVKEVKEEIKQIKITDLRIIART